MRKLTEFNNIADNWIDFREYITLCITIRAAGNLLFGLLSRAWHSWHFTTFRLYWAAWGGAIIFIIHLWLSTHHLHLAILTKYLMAR